MAKVIKKATQKTEQPAKKATVISRKEHEKLMHESARQINEKKREITSVKNENLTLKERLNELEAWANEQGKGIEHTASNAAEGVNSVTSRKWVGAVLLVLLLIAVGIAIALNSKVYKLEREKVELQSQLVAAQQSAKETGSKQGLEDVRTQVFKNNPEDVKKKPVPKH